MRRTWKTAAWRGRHPMARVFAGALALATAGFVALGGSAWAAPVVTVTPNDFLTDGQVVTLSGTGFTAGQSVLMFQCHDDAPNPTSNDCDSNTLAFTAVRSGGVFNSSYTVRRSITTSQWGTVDCQVDACVVMVRTSTGTYLAHSARLNFEPPPPPLEMVLTVDPLAQRDGRTGMVTLTGTLTCNLPAAALLHASDAVQGKVAAGVAVSSPIQTVCAESTSSWSMTISSAVGKYHGGALDVSVVVDGDAGRGNTAGVQVDASVRLRGNV